MSIYGKWYRYGITDMEEEKTKTLAFRLQWFPATYMSMVKTPRYFRKSSHK